MATIGATTSTTMCATNATMATATPTCAHLLGMGHHHFVRCLLERRRPVTVHLPNLGRWPVEWTVNLLEFKGSTNPIDSASLIPAFMKFISRLKFF